MRLLAPLIVLFFATICPAQDSDPQLALQQAEALFAEGTALLAESPSKAGGLLERSARQMQRAAQEGGFENGYLEYNTGNAYLLAGELGRAIVHYKRARRLIPNDENLAANLAIARSRVTDRIESSGERQIARTIFFWHYDIPAPLRAAGMIGAWALLWIAGAWWLLRGWRPGLSWAIGLAAVGCIALSASLWVDHRERADSRQGVVTADSVIARTGPDASAYGKRFERPLSQGVEVRIVETRAGWVFIRLADGREAWIPEQSIERV